MNKEWSEQNKKVQLLIKKADTFDQGKDVLFGLRKELWDTLLSFKEELKREDFDAMPFMNADGYHCKNIAYSIWHIFRIEDIVAHTLVNGDEEVLFTGDYQRRINSPIITTGNELVKEQISDFTKKLDIDELYSYAADVKKSTEEIIRNLNAGERTAVSGCRQHGRERGLADRLLVQKRCERAHSDAVFEALDHAY